MAKHLDFWVIYKNPSDYPGKFVVRRHRAKSDGTVEVSAECTVHDKLIPARETMPGGLHHIGRQINDDPCVLEVWV